jgi:threonine dehydrogenase-like Zn-dependent dehydrogenase
LAVGAGAVVLSEPLEARRHIASAAGALAVAPGSVESSVRALTVGRGADVVIDAVGGAAMLEAAVELVRPAGTIASVGVPGHGSWSPTVGRLFADEITLRFVVGDAMRDFDALLSLMRGGQVDPLPLITATVPLDDLPEAFASGAVRSGVKTLVEM